MTPRLAELVRLAHAVDAPWDAGRIAQLREGVRHRRRERARRARLRGRVGVALSVAGFLVVAVLRAASSPSADFASADRVPVSIEAPARTAPTDPALREVLATRALDDGGYSRD